LIILSLHSVYHRLTKLTFLLGFLYRSGDFYNGRVQIRTMEGSKLHLLDWSLTQEVPLGCYIVRTLALKLKLLNIHFVMINKLKRKRTQAWFLNLISLKCKKERLKNIYIWFIVLSTVQYSLHSYFLCLLCSSPLAC